MIILKRNYNYKKNQVITNTLTDFFIALFARICYVAADDAVQFNFHFSLLTTLLKTKTTL